MLKASLCCDLVDHQFNHFKINTTCAYYKLDATLKILDDKISYPPKVLGILFSFLLLGVIILLVLSLAHAPFRKGGQSLNRGQRE